MLSLNALIEQLLAVRQLPTLSPVALMLEQSLESEDADIHRVSRIIGDDPSITSMVLKLANSVAYGSRRTISSVQEAVVRLGFKEIRKMVFDLSVVRLLTDREDSRLDPIGFWEHSIGVAHCMELIDERIGVMPQDGPQAHVVGLLHDLGRWVSATYLSEYYQEIPRDVVPRRDITALERDHIGLDHAQIGAALLERWGLPLKIVHCVRFHHQPEVAPRPERQIAHLIHLSDGFCRAAGIGDVGEGLPAGEKQHESMEQLHLDPQICEELAPLIRERMARSDVLLSIGGLERKHGPNSGH